MKKLATQSRCFKHEQCPNASSLWRKLSRCLLASTLLAVGCLSPTAQAQTTIKPYQIRAEVPTGFSGTVILSNNVMRVATNGASVLDGTGTNWVIPDVNVSITGAPPGVTATPVDSSENPVTTVPIHMNINNASQSTNLWVKLDFDGTQASSTYTLSFNATGGLTNTSVFLTLEVGKIWNGSGNALADGPGNWSSSSSWLGGSSPGENDNVVFTDVGTQTNSVTAGNLLTNSVVDINTTIASLRFAQTNSATNYHNLYINPGVTLAIKGAGGFSMLRDITYVATKMNVTIAGTNGTLVQTNENSNFSMLVDGQQASVLDMSGLGNLYLDVNRLSIGDIEAYPNYMNLLTNGYSQNSTTIGAAMPMRVLPTWRMAMTNYVRAVYVDPYNYTNVFSRSYALEIGRNNYGGGSSAADHVLNMGLTNVFYMDGICVAGYASLGGVLQFQNSGSYALFRNTNGGRMSIFAAADAAGTTYGITTGDNTKCASPGVDFSKGTVDMLVDRFYLSLDRGNVASSGKGVSQTAFVVSSGIIDANTAILGYQSAGDQTNQSYCYATMTVSNTAVLKVNDTLALGYATATRGGVNAEENGYGQIAIGPGGTVMANNITVGGVTKASSKNAITLTSGASLIVSNGIADASPYGALGTLSLKGNSSLTLFVNTTNTIPLVYVTNLTASSTGNKLIIGGVVTNASTTYPVTVPLIFGANPSIPVLTSVFDAGVTMPPGFHGVLLANASANEIDLLVYNRQPGYLLWRGPAGGSGTADWDYTSKNWLDQVTGIMTNYNNPDYVAFDDAPGYATNINIAGGTIALSPSAIAMTNNTLYYTFLDGGNTILGGPALNKYGTGGLEIDGNTTASVALNQGVLSGTSSGSMGGVSIAAGAVMNYAGSIGGSITCSGTGTSSGSIAGTLTVLTGGVMTNSGTIANTMSVQAGGFLYNSDSGALNNVGTGSAATPQVAKGGEFVNNGVISGDLLYINGTFEDLGGAFDNITLTSVSMGPGGTFIPGGDAVGNTTINSDGVGSFPGAALLAQGSTNVFKIDVAGSANTVLTANFLSFGGSASTQTQNGCTLVINNVSGTPFSAGQSFQLFHNVNNTGVAPYSTGSSTNTFPVISPPTPGPGLAWDLSHLWVPNGAGNSGVLGVVSSSGGPTLTNSFARVGTNIVGQFSWDASDYGWRLESLVAPLSVGLAPNTNYTWTGVAGSWTNTTMTITNMVGTNSVFYRLTFP